MILVACKKIGKTLFLSMQLDYCNTFILQHYTYTCYSDIPSLSI